MGRHSTALSYYSPDPYTVVQDKYSCLLCGKELNCKYSSNAIHHLKNIHPEIDYTTPFGGATGEVQDDQDDTSLDPSEHTMDFKQPEEKETIRVAKVATLKRIPAKRRRHSTEAEEPETEDLPAARILDRLKQINLEQAALKNQVNLDKAEFENQLLQQQFDSQRQLRMIQELQKEVNILKKHKSQGNGHDLANEIEEERDEDDLPRFPLFRMQQVDDLEERIINEPEFKEKLGRLFKTGQMDKVDSILSWFSSETLVQFTHKTDQESLVTHRSTEFSAIFELMFSMWTTEGYNKKDFIATIKSALETASSQLAAENNERNRRMRKRKARNDSFFECSDAEDGPTDQHQMDNKVFITMQDSYE